MRCGAINRNLVVVLKRKTGRIGQGIFALWIDEDNLNMISADKVAGSSERQIEHANVVPIES